MTASADRDLEQFERNCLEFLRSFLSMKTGSVVDEKGAYPSKPKRAVGSNTTVLTREQTIAAVLQHRPRRPPEGVVPPGLPEEVRARASDMNAESLATCYPLDHTEELVSNHTLTRLEVIQMHLCSYRNILELELSDLPDLHSRFVRFFNRVFTELMDRLYPGRKPAQSPVSEMCGC